MLRTQSLLKLTTIIALVCLIVGALAPNLITQRTRPLSFKEDISVTMGPAKAQIARCAAEDDCTGETQELAITRHSTTAKTDVDDAAAQSESFIEATLDGEKVAEISHSALLNRESAYPMAGTDTSQEFSIRGGAVLNAEGADIDGIDFFFPSQTEQRSYPYFDPVMQKAEPIDYLTDEKIDGIPTYSFYQQRQGINVSHLFDDRRFPENLSPYYAVERTVWVEPTTGRVVDVKEKMHIYLAHSKQEEPDAGSTLFATEISWDQASTQAELDKVKNTVLAIKVVSIIGWALAIIGAVLLVFCAWRFSRQREK